MDKPKITPKDFFLWAGAMVTFYWSVIATTFLIFDYINYLFPNPLAGYIDPYQSGISYEMASIIVLLPIFFFLMRIIRADIARDPSRGEIWVRRWALIFTLFVSGIAMAIDLITLLTTFLSGEALTAAFLLKALVIFIVAGLVFWYFILDLRGYWDMHPSHRRLAVVGVALAAVLIIVAGFFIVGTPQHARLMRFDAEKVQDLQNIQYQITNYYQAKQKLPTALNDLDNSLAYTTLPLDPETNESYVYLPTGALSFKLCATFNAVGGGGVNTYAMPSSVGTKGSQDNWQHDSGNVCFDRTIDPAFYPPFNK